MSKTALRNSHQKRQLKIRLSHGHTHVNCCFCKRRIAIEKATIEHIVPLALNGGWAIENLALSCFTCNNDRGVADFIEYRKWRRGQTKDKPNTTMLYEETLIQESA